MSEAKAITVEQALQGVEIGATAARGIRGMAIALVTSLEPGSPAYREGLAIIHYCTDLLTGLEMLTGADTGPAPTAAAIRDIKQALH